MVRFLSMVGAAALVAVVAASPASAAGDAVAGQKLFSKCAACHDVTAGKNKVGPSLAGIAGRKAGTVDGFNYSPAMKSAGVVWTEENLGKYLEKPKEFIAGNKMAFPGLADGTDRMNLVAYLATVK